MQRYPENANVKVSAHFITASVTQWQYLYWCETIGYF